MTLTRKQIAKSMAKDINCTQKKAYEILSTMLRTIESALAEGDSVSLRKFGKFYTTTLKSREIKHPLTRKRLEVRKKNIVKFKYSPSAENDLNVIEWCCDDERNLKILQELYELIENAEMVDGEEDEMMYYPGKYSRV